MIDFSNINNWITLAGALVTALGGAFITVKKIIRMIEKSKKKHAAEILQAAKNNDVFIRTELLGQIHDLDQKITSVKDNTEKDLNHLKEMYSSEIRAIGDKISVLRSEVHQQHGQIIALLTKMLGKD